MDVLVLCVPILVLALTNLSQSKRIDDTRAQVHELRNQLGEVMRETAKAGGFGECSERH